MAVELVGDNGHRTIIPTGWVILVLALAAWGVTALLWFGVSKLLALG
jgi:hypothetical protein